MKKLGLMICLMAGTFVLMADEADAQRFRSRINTRPIYNGQDVEGMTTTNDVGFVIPQNSMRMAVSNPFSPNRVFTYTNRGIQAGLTHQWNQEQARSQPWHGNFQYWRYGEPTALVVPPTASFETSYGWGVGQVRNHPIHHQYGKAGAGTLRGKDNSFTPTPYWPSHTSQFGVYPVRAPW